MESGGKSMGRSRLTTAGNLLIGLGVAVWVVYAVMRWGFGGTPEVERYLPYHLAGVIPGALLRHRHALLRLVGR